MKSSTLRLLLSKHPDLTKDQIKIIVSQHLKVINSRISNNTTFNLKIPKFGRIHTHGNSKNKAYVARLKRHKKWRDNKNDFSDKTLLF